MVGVAYDSAQYWNVVSWLIMRLLYNDLWSHIGHPDIQVEHQPQLDVCLHYHKLPLEYTEQTIFTASTVTSLQLL